MRYYRVQVKDGSATRYATSHADARGWRRDLADQQGCRLKDIDIEQIDVPTGRHALAEWLNNELEAYDCEFDLEAVPQHDAQKDGDDERALH